MFSGRAGPGPAGVSSQDGPMYSRPQPRASLLTPLHTGLLKTVCGQKRWAALSTALG